MSEALQQVLEDLEQLRRERQDYYRGVPGAEPTERNLLAAEDGFKQKRREAAYAATRQLADDPERLLTDTAISIHLALYQLCVQAMREVIDEN